MCKKIEQYKIIYEAYANEIHHLWQRSIFLGAFMVLVWSGYGALQLQYISHKATFYLTAYHIASVMLCVAIMVFSTLWIAMAKGSKFVQEAHEKKSDKGVVTKLEEYTDFYCNLNDYTKYEKTNHITSLLCCPLSAYRFSPSKINIALGYVSLLFATMLLAFHILYGLDILQNIWRYIQEYKILIVIIGVLIFVFVLFASTYFLKGKNTR